MLMNSVQLVAPWTQTGHRGPIQITVETSFPHVFPCTITAGEQGIMMHGNVSN